MHLRSHFSALGIIGILLVSGFHTGLAYRGLHQGLSLAASALLTISDFKLAEAFPPLFAHRNGRPGPGAGPSDASFEESDEDDDDNESQARVEPQITPLNRDECLAKLLCGMSVPVTGGGTPKNGYYSEYAQIVAKFFDAFPLEDNDADNKSHESLELYDDYSVEDTRPTRLNSKNKQIESTTKSSSGLQLFDLALIKTAKPLNKTDDDERNDRSFDGFDANIKKRLSRARKIISKLGEKLQTVKQCQKITGCPFTFKDLRKRINTKATISSNVPLGSPSVNYKPGYKPKPLSTELTLGNPQPLTTSGNSQSDDELEEFFGTGPPPVMIHRPSSGYGINQMMGSNYNKRKKPEIAQYQYQAQNDPNQQQYVPYNPPVRYNQANQNQKPGPLFPKKKVGYQIPSFVKKPQQSGEDEFDNVNQSIGPVSLIGGSQEQQQQFIQQQFYNNQANSNNDNDNQAQESQDNTDNADDDSEGEGDYDEEGDYEDEDYEDAGSDESVEEDEEQSEEDEKEETSQEKEKDKAPNKKDVQNEEVTTKKPKIKGYKKPSFVKVQVEDEFDLKKPGDDESDNPEWSKFAFATTGGLLKEPAERNKTKLQEKNDQKLNLSKESDEEVKASDENSDENSEEARSDKRKEKPSLLTLDDDEVFETTKDGYFLSSTNPRTKPKTKYRRGNSKAKAKSTKKKPERKAAKKPVKEANSDEEERVPEQKKKPQPTLTHIGGRPIAPEPERQTAQTNTKTSPLSRFNFNLIRPYSTTYQSESPVTSPKIRSSLPLSPSSNSYNPSKKPSSEGNSFKKESTATKSESYLPSVSFGASNGGKVGTVEYLSAPSTQTQSGMHGLTFPFSPISTLKRLFKRPGSTSQMNQDIPGNAPHSPFVHRPVGPESNNYKRHSPSTSSSTSSKARSGVKKNKKGGRKSPKGKGKKSRRH